VLALPLALALAACGAEPPAAAPAAAPPATSAAAPAAAPSGTARPVPAAEPAPEPAAGPGPEPALPAKPPPAKGSAAPREGVRAEPPPDIVGGVADPPPYDIEPGRADGVGRSGPGRTIPVSVNGVGAMGNGISHSQAISADGRYVAFESQSSNIDGVELFDQFEVYVHDLDSSRTERISVGPGGRDPDRSSGQPVLSADGRYVAFMSEATNLLPEAGARGGEGGDTNGRDDIYLRDRRTGALERVSVPTGAGGAQANGNSQMPSVSADGRFVAFDSYADNLVPGDTNGLSDVFVRDRVAGTTERVNVGPGGRQARADSGQAVISADGRYVAFESWAGDLAPGRDGNRAYDIFVRDRVARATERVSVTPGGAAANAASFAPSISADGRFVAFDSPASDLVPGDTNGRYDVFVRDRATSTTARVSVDSRGRQVAADSALASISGDGRHVGYHSYAAGLVPDDRNRSRDVFLYDRRTRGVVRVSVTGDGRDAFGVSGAPSLSYDGRRVAFDSLASNLAPGDHNATDDIFVRDRGRDL
jgi:Tol biopolymer transport system component